MRLATMVRVKYAQFSWKEMAVYHFFIMLLGIIAFPTCNGTHHGIHVTPMTICFSIYYSLVANWPFLT